MFYSFGLPIPANTLKTAPKELEVNLTWGVITEVEIRFPPRCVGLANIKILERRHQLWPTNLDEWFYGDDETIKWDEYHELFEMPAIFTLLGYNGDDTFPHTPIIRFEILHPLAAMAKYGGVSPYPQVRRITWEEL
uniref:Uncharacterized protein n=1 Tax=viral metagenome TaxID=1070528 RepID=A0A6H2A1X5_9ZZZZ